MPRHLMAKMAARIRFYEKEEPKPGGSLAAQKRREKEAELSAKRDVSILLTGPKPKNIYKPNEHTN